MKPPEKGTFVSTLNPSEENISNTVSDSHELQEEPKQSPKIISG